MMISGNEVWEKLLTDQRMVGWHPAVVEGHRRFVEALPEILKDMLGLPATTNNLLAAREKFVRYLLANSYARELADIAAQGLEPSQKVELVGMVEADMLTSLEPTSDTYQTLVVESIKVFGLTIEDVLREFPGMLVFGGEPPL